MSTLSDEIGALLDKDCAYWQQRYLATLEGHIAENNEALRKIRFERDSLVKYKCAAPFLFGYCCLVSFAVGFLLVVGVR